MVAGIYGMNFDVMPELRWSLGYPLALLGMLCVRRPLRGLQALWVALTCRCCGDILEDCFFKTDDETDEEIRAWGYQRLVSRLSHRANCSGED